MEIRFELQTLLLVIAALTAGLSYILLPRAPAAAIVLCAAVALVVGVWWHWTQFSEEYRQSTWQYQLRNYAGFAMVLTVIVCAFGFYAMMANDTGIQRAAASSQSVLMSAGSSALNSLSDGFNAMTENTTALFSPSPEDDEGEDEAPVRNKNRNGANLFGLPIGLPTELPFGLGLGNGNGNKGPNRNRNKNARNKFPMNNDNIF